MYDGPQGIADYSIWDAFMRLTTVSLNDPKQKRGYTFRQRRIWSSTLVLLENDIQVGEFRPTFLGSPPYRILVNQDVPTNIVLLCVWITLIRLAFTA